MKNIAFEISQLENHSFAKLHTNEQTETNNESHTAIILNQITRHIVEKQKSWCKKYKSKLSLSLSKRNKMKHYQTIPAHRLCKQTKIVEKKLMQNHTFASKIKYKNWINSWIANSLNWCTNVEITACSTQKVMNQHFDMHWRLFCPHRCDWILLCLARINIFMFLKLSKTFANEIDRQKPKT